MISDLQTIDICGHSRLCEGPHNLSFITRELCADAVVFQLFLSCWWRALPKLQSATSEPTILRVLSVRMVLTVKSAKFQFFPADFWSFFVPLFGAAGDRHLSDVCGQQRKPLWCFSGNEIL